MRFFKYLLSETSIRMYAKSLLKAVFLLIRKFVLTRFPM